ncbi:uncharacterized protein LOC132603497 isoform X1 [Lycium barbarum]|uniref:uncharacterized protein LOC132603497 isoform X1 n=2 Tax=Lycium barbarum TaxID=112863 RepID=UPI00293E967A|nr:uncharacterized protein LOC132603497 isoform X1 [Lycium barbarum]
MCGTTFYHQVFYKFSILFQFPLQLNMVQKRPYSEEKLYEVSSKQPRHVESNSRLVPVLDYFHHESVAMMKRCASGGDGGNNKKPDSGNIAETPFSPDQDVDTCIDGSASNSSWPTSSTSEEDIGFEVPFDTLRSPEYYIPSRTITHPREVYFSLLRNSPQKLVPIGPDFQAELPEWSGHSSKDEPIMEETHENMNLPSQALESYRVDHFCDENKLAGTCIIPMHNAELPADKGEIAGVERVECSCEDKGSMKCVRLHIKEAREKLKISLGEETFVRLGFCGVGEVVTEKWREEEGDLFHEVVFSNPASLGKDFWNKLAIKFPSRTRKELVSYYFNIFILRKRAKQNRFDPSNVDSDNDEWQEIDDTADDKDNMTDEDEDSVVESPEYNNSLGCNEIYRDDIQAYYENVGFTVWEVYKPLGFGSRKVFTELSAAECPDKLFDTNCSSKPTIQHLNRGVSDEAGSYDGSCTRDAPGVAPETPLGKTVNGRHWASDFACIGSDNGHDFLLGPCGVKEWDIGYLCCAKNEVDLLPTHTMIEEVFGDGAWSYKSRRDGHGLS